MHDDLNILQKPSKSISRQRKKLHILEPSQSPDLDPRVHAFESMKRNLNAESPTNTDDSNTKGLVKHITGGVSAFCDHGVTDLFIKKSLHLLNSHSLFALTVC